MEKKDIKIIKEDFYFNGDPKDYPDSMLFDEHKDIAGYTAVDENGNNIDLWLTVDGEKCIHRLYTEFEKDNGEATFHNTSDYDEEIIEDIKKGMLLDDSDKYSISLNNWFSLRCEVTSSDGKTIYDDSETFLDFDEDSIDEIKSVLRDRAKETLIFLYENGKIKEAESPIHDFDWNENKRLFVPKTVNNVNSDIQTDRLYVRGVIRLEDIEKELDTTLREHIAKDIPYRMAFLLNSYAEILFSNSELNSNINFLKGFNTYLASCPEFTEFKDASLLKDVALYRYIDDTGLTGYYYKTYIDIDLKPLIERFMKETKELDKLVDDEDWKVRLKVAEQGYGLDKLINDEDSDVRYAVAKQRYGLDKLVNDEDWNVRRLVASQGYGLDKLVNDKVPWVRCEVAKQGYGLNKLINDNHQYVRNAVENYLEYNDYKDLKEWKEKNPDKVYNKDSKTKNKGEER